jgi:hypothetical protein
MDTLLANTIIDRLGGTSETARLCDVKPPSVSDWRKTGIPRAQLKFLKLARPDVFEEAEIAAALGSSSPTASGNDQQVSP